VTVPFFYDWRFLLALVLLALLFFFVVVACLCWTGRQSAYEGKAHKRRSIDSLSLADGGVVTYEMHRAKRSPRGMMTNHNMVDPPRPNPLLHTYNDDDTLRASAPPVYDTTDTPQLAVITAPSTPRSYHHNNLYGRYVAVRSGLVFSQDRRRHVDDGRQLEQQCRRRSAARLDGRRSGVDCKPLRDAERPTSGDVAESAADGADE